MKLGNFIHAMHQRTAVTAVGPSAMRGQGKGVLEATQDYLAKLNLASIPKSTQNDFLHWLDRATESLLTKLPIKNRPWGAARKAINLFLRDLLYNQYLNDHFEFGQIESWLEVPLDSAVAKGLKERAGRAQLPQWPRLKRLKQDVSEQFQAFAADYAATHNIHRVHLDIYLWLENRKPRIRKQE